MASGAYSEWRINSRHPSHACPAFAVGGINLCSASSLWPGAFSVGGPRRTRRHVAGRGRS